MTFLSLGDKLSEGVFVETRAKAAQEWSWC